ncbi:hypothetical protein PQR15_15045 [Streptomyces lydicus]|nr:hypothetical protein [Streptomyces lydicus]
MGRARPPARGRRGRHRRTGADPADPGQDPALQTRPSLAAAGFHPWRTTLVKRPKGYAAEVPYCTSGDGAVFCGQSGLPAARLNPETGAVVWRRTAALAGRDAVSPTLRCSPAGCSTSSPPTAPG